MKRCKKLLLGVFGGLVIVGLCCLQGATSEAVSIKDGPSGDSERELIRKALRTILNTDGSFSTLSVTTFSPTTLNTGGTSTLGPGTRNDGWVVAKSTELTTTGGSIGTLSSMLLEGSNTYYIQAAVLGQGSTVTAMRAGFLIDGTVYRDGTASATLLGTSTISSDLATNYVPAPLGAYISVLGNNVGVTVVGSATSDMRWTTNLRYLNISN